MGWDYQKARGMTAQSACNFRTAHSLAIMRKTGGSAMADRLDAMAQHMWDARRARTKYANLPDDLKPGSIAEAYRAQEVYHRLAEPVYGPVGGVKVATTTKVMQELMG